MGLKFDCYSNLKSGVTRFNTITLASILSKILENIILERIEIHLITNSNQFGFKHSYGTVQCMYVHKEVVNLYMSRKSCIYTSFLDASRAFDRDNHRILFVKLEKRGAPSYILRLLIHWYQKQNISVKWGSTISELFSVYDGVRPFFM